MTDTDDSPPNVLLLTADALRADHVSWYGYDRSTTPAIDSLARRGLTGKNVFSASSHTREAVPSILTGHYPAGCVGEGYGLRGRTLPAILSERGYTTAAFHSNPYLSRAYGYGDSFDEFDDDLHLGDSKLLTLAQRALDRLRNRHYARVETINQRALDWLDDTAEPFFCWLHYMDPHGPYAAPPSDREVYADRPVRTKAADELYRRAAVTDPESVTGDERDWLRDCYDEEIRYLDTQISRLFQSLSSRNRLDDTLVVLTADHGELFGEHGQYGHPRYLHDELLRVPLMMLSEQLPSRTVETAASTLDIVPTVLSLCGLPTDEFPGRPLDAVESSEVDKNRHVFSMVRGENDSDDRRRFGVHTANESCRLERSVEEEYEEWRGCGDDRLRQLLREFSENRVTRSTSEKASPEEQPDHIQDRLQTLGYRE